MLSAFMALGGITSGISSTAGAADEPGANFVWLLALAGCSYCNAIFVIFTVHAHPLEEVASII